ncbi:Fasciculation and elongation protein [Dirofilaria immitis]|nr:Fasciculation and elongation protein zeta-2 [Dirofilaria immitis]
MGTGMGEDINCSVPEVPLAHLEDDIDFIKAASQQSTSDCENNFDGNFDLENLSGSLEDLVGTFDQKISQCFKDLNEATEEIAPIQVRSQDEIMSESQIWWTLTGNFGNMPPLDFSKTQTRRLQLPALNLQPHKENSDPGIDLSEEDEELRSALDMHQLISQRGPLSESPPQTADQVIEEIDEMLQSCDFSGSVMTDHTMESMDSMYSSMRSPLPNGQYEMEVKLRQTVTIASNSENLESFSYSRLLALSAEMEQLIQIYNDSLVEQLAHRDELEYEKEMKNTFISLLLSIQNRRRHFVNERKRKPLKIDPSQLPQYMTATIPYDENHLSMDMNTMMALIKLLRAIDEDCPAVPNMLTDYILTVLCPSASSSVITDLAA